MASTTEESVDQNLKRPRKKERNPLYNKKIKLSYDDEIKRITDRYEKIDTSQVKKFSHFPLSKKTFDGLKAAGYYEPTEIQREAVGYALQGRDILGAAKTGSGKTLAFVIPILECLFRNKYSVFDGLGALIISPTRELAYQTFEVLRRVGRKHDFSAGLVIGGKDVEEEAGRIGRTNIIICTPGRLLQHMDQTSLFNCDQLKILVLDEADRILDLGFAPTMNAIIENLPHERQTLLFSATQTKSVKDLARLSLKTPMYVSVHEHAEYSTPKQLQQSYVVCEVEDKLNLVWNFIKHHLKQKIIVFLQSCKQVRFVYEAICKLRPGAPVMALHGAMNQMKRVGVYEQFCRKEFAVLLATDIAARGLDFPAVNWVVQLDCPEDASTYIHRVGRTARFQEDGEALLVLTPREETAMLEQLKLKKIPIERIEVNPKRMQYSLESKLQSFCAQFPELKEAAQRAFVSYIRSVFLMKNKAVFDAFSINMDEFAKSLGLAITPRVRFLQKEKRRLEEKEGKESHSEEVKEEVKEEEKEGISQPKKKAQGWYGEDSDEELFIKKEAELVDDSEEVLEELKAKDKTFTKAAMAKKVLRKKLVISQKVVFDEEGEMVEDALNKVHTVRSDDMEDKGGINIEEAKKYLQEEDKYDKENYRARVKRMHQERRVKLKAERKAAHADAAEEEAEDDDEEGPVLDQASDAESFDPDTLPDPAKFCSEDNDKDSLEDSESEDEDNPSAQQSDSEDQSTSSDESEEFDTGLSLRADEELALQLLGK